MTVNRCGWCVSDSQMMRYHDEEWGTPFHDDRKQFEFLTLEVMQCGLNWMMMLKKREIFRECFQNFDYSKISEYGPSDIERILDTPGMIRSPRKINAVIGNAKAFIKIREEYGTFDRYIRGFTQNRTLTYRSHQTAGVARNELSDRISADLKKRGFRYIGSITLYAHLQACGIINDHECGCFRYQELTEQENHCFVD